MAWIDYLHIVGGADAKTGAELYAGIGAVDRSRTENYYRGVIRNNFETLGAWVTECLTAYSQARTDKREGNTVALANLTPPPVMEVISDDNIDYPSPYYWWSIAQYGFSLLFSELFRTIVSESINSISDGGKSDPFLSIFRKFAFLREEDRDLGFPDLTSLLLLIGERAIEIYDGYGHKDVFLDTRIDEEEG